MKKLTVLFIFGLFLFNTNVFGQEKIDSQWLILDGRSVINNERFENEVCIHTVKQATYPKRDDIFIIFDDSTFFNSRYSNSFKYSSKGNLNLKFTNTPKNIEYLYLTNVYDTDDPDEKASKNLCGNIVNNKSATTLLGNKISANHDVTPVSDIVLIINIENIKPQKTFTLSFDQVKKQDGTTITTHELFTPRKIFMNGTEAVIGKGITKYTIINNDKLEFVIQDSSALVFLALKPNSERISNYLSSNPDSVYSALFTLRDNNNNNNNNTVAKLEEEIRPVHDPNFIAVQSVCEDDNNYIVNYLLHYENDLEGDVCNHRAEFNLPTCLKNYKRLEIISSKVGGIDVKPDSFIIEKWSKIIFSWENSCISKDVSGNNRDQGVVEVSFNVVVPKNIYNNNNNNNNNSIRFISLKTYDGHTYFIKEQYDITSIDNKTEEGGFMRIIKKCPLSTKKQLCKWNWWYVLLAALAIIIAITIGLKTKKY